MLSTTGFCMDSKGRVNLSTGFSAPIPNMSERFPIQMLIYSCTPCFERSIMTNSLEGGVVDVYIYIYANLYTYIHTLLYWKKHTLLK